MQSLPYISHILEFARVSEEHEKNISYIFVDNLL